MSWTGGGTGMTGLVVFPGECPGQPSQPGGHQAPLGVTPDPAGVTELVVSPGEFPGQSSQPGGHQAPLGVTPKPCRGTVGVVWGQAAAAQRVAGVVFPWECGDDPWARRAGWGGQGMLLHLLHPSVCVHRIVLHFLDPSVRLKDPPAHPPSLTESKGSSYPPSASRRSRRPLLHILRAPSRRLRREAVAVATCVRRRAGREGGRGCSAQGWLPADTQRCLLRAMGSPEGRARSPCPTSPGRPRGPGFDEHHRDKS